MTQRRIWLKLGVLVGAFLLGIAALLLPPVADHFGYARPLPHGLPSRYTMFGISFEYHPGCNIPLKRGHCTSFRGLNASLPTCPTATYLRRHHYWPLQEIGTIPTLFEPAHPVYNILAGWSTAPPYSLYLVKDGSCYLPYRQAPSK